MAFACVAAVPPSHLISGFHHPNTRFKLAPKSSPIGPIRSSRRSKNSERWKRTGFFSIFASNTNPSGGDSATEKSDAIEAGDRSRGPPFLTILAGLLVFFLICWVVGSTVLWLIGLFVK